jgi:hypothetical protein
MDRCRWCKSADLELVEYVETSLFGDTVRVVIVYCETCGSAETVSSRMLPASA